MGIKMGKYNAITPERFHLIKAALAEWVSDSEVMAKYEIKKTTLRYIKRSTSFYEYRLLTEALPAARKMPKVVAPSSGLEFEDFSYRKNKGDKAAAEKRASREDGATNKMVALVAVEAIAIISLVALTALVYFWNQK